MFLWRNKKNYPRIIIKYSCLTIPLLTDRQAWPNIILQCLIKVNYTICPPSSHFQTYDLIVLGFNDTSTLEGHFVSSPREREKRDRRESRGDEREGQGRKRNRNESEETEEIKTFPLYPYPLQGWQALPNCKPISDGRPLQTYKQVVKSSFRTSLVRM